MNKTQKILLITMMSLALAFGFLDPLFPEAPISFKRLHIFLFNLCCGGSLLIYYTEGPGKPGFKTFQFLTVAILYSLGAALRLYPLTILLSIPLLWTVESVRIKRFSLFPFNFFRGSTPVHEKFHHASLLCLSMGIVIATLVILNNSYINIVSYKKLQLDVFFLGYSFPISLVTLSIMSSFMTRNESPLYFQLRQLTFWTINLGVIIFFLFIILENTPAEVICSTILFISVCIVYYLFVQQSPDVQQKAFLISGLTFLMFTAITGILYIMRYFFTIPEDLYRNFLVWHGTISLYGWNLSGLFIIIRWTDFPIRLNSSTSIVLHWLIVFILVPLGKYLPYLGLIATVAYVFLLQTVFFSKASPNDLKNG